MDKSLFKWINSGWSPKLEPWMRFLSEGLDSIFVKIGLIVILIVLLFTNQRNSRRSTICALIAFPLADGLTHLLKTLMPMPRPNNDPRFLDLIIARTTSESMGTASAHAANMMAVAICFTIGMRWWGVSWIFVALAVGISRVYMAAHYPSQVLFGWLCGAFMGVLVSLVYQLVQAKWFPSQNPADTSPVSSTIDG